ncbi:hypothetical protein BC829DRAFT_60982 [Chytridium lagenaria]|nr:hypothetical protein BC829DRAFT_60982 [Chytridium lagenaria]
MARNRAAKMNITAAEFVPSPGNGGGSGSNSGSSGSLSRSNSRRSNPQPVSFSKNNNTSQARPRRQSQREKKAARQSGPNVVVDDYEIVGIGLANKRGEISLNHLMNFTFPPREQSTLAPVKKRGVSYQPFMKERFINANYRFVMDPNGDYTINLFDSDIIVEWNDIHQVLVPATKVFHCPICLCEPIAPRITRCGHIYCFSCILHYLSLDDGSKWMKCPICHDAVYGKDLKNARFMHLEFLTKISPMTPREIPMTLIKRAINSSLALPRASYSQWNRHPKSITQIVPPTVGNAELFPFAKLMLANDSYMKNHILDPDRRDLGIALNEALHEEAMMKALGGDRSKAAMEAGLASSGSERPFIEMALTDVKAKLSKVHIVEGEPEPACDVAVGKKPVKGNEYGMIRKEPEQIIGEPEVAGSGGKESEARRPLKSRSNGPPSDGFYYFYQASDGQNVYLHPLEIKMLLHEFSEYDQFPDQIVVKAMIIQESTMTEELKKKCKYLSHVPLSCDLSFCEIDLTGVVSDDTIKYFDKELSERRRKYLKMERELEEEIKAKEAESIVDFSSSPNSGFHGHADPSREQIAHSWEDPALFDTLWPAAKPMLGAQGSSSSANATSSDDNASTHSTSPPRQASRDGGAWGTSKSFATIAKASGSTQNSWAPQSSSGAAVRKSNRILIGADSEDEAYGYAVDDELGWALDLEDGCGCEFWWPECRFCERQGKRECVCRCFHP